MKFRRKDFEIFNLSFLDIISCGFGAVVLLVLISNTAENQTSGSDDSAQSLLRQVIALETRVDALSLEVETLQNKSAARKAESANLEAASMELTRQLGQEDEEKKKLDGDLQGLSLVEETLKRVSIKPATTKITRDEEVGGIPVDSDYVIFVVDISGSMRDIWDRVSREILNVLSIHPKVKGFQILDDNGNELIGGYAGKWMPDTSGNRERAMKIFDIWAGASDSNPVDGIERALRTYGKAGRSMSIYVFGDDYTGKTYDDVIDNVTKLNTVGGKHLAKIHGVGFRSLRTTDHFAILMRELSRRNGGTFLALKDQ